jgi:hypothetical protein
MIQTLFSKWKVLILIIVIAIPITPSINSTQDYPHTDSSQTQWTVMYYMCCDSYMNEYAEPLLANLSDIGSTSEMNLVVLYDGNQSNDTKLYYIDTTGSLVCLNSLFNWPDEVDMSRKETFERYCTDIMSTYPAEYYAFITYASGATGWQMYPLDDDDGRGYLTLPEFSESLQNITQNGTNKLDVLQTSCCMSSIELIHEIAPYVQYMITTQEHITNHRIIQRHYLAVNDLHDNPMMNPEEFCVRAAENHVPQQCNYWESYEYEIWDSITNFLDNTNIPAFSKVKVKTSVTIINLSTTEALIDHVDTLSIYLQSQLQNQELNQQIQQAWKSTRKYGNAISKHPFTNFLYSTIPFDRFLGS